MLITQKRPRDLKWYHAGPLLFGDWGTSRLYVLGLAFYYTAHASVLYLAAMSIIMAAVAWAYTVVCRCFPEGGGVYTAARQLNELLSVLGATLLMGGYIITTAISVVVAFHYFGLPMGEDGGGLRLFALSTIVIGLLGVVNWFGARTAGRLALFIAVAAVGVSVVVATVSLPLVREGARTISMPSRPAWEQWTSFVAIVLALSGVESVANMTGLMKEPVAHTAKRTIWPVLAEVVTLNILFGLALTGLPALVGVQTPDAIMSAGSPGPEVVAYRDTAMRVLATATLGNTLGWVASIVFGMLLLSAANTAIVAKVSVLFALSHDDELPRGLSKLNYSGVPWVAVIVSCMVPMIVLAVERDVEALAKLYAIGVCGAVTINVLCCAINPRLSISRAERAGMWAVGVFMLSVTGTIIATEWRATLFAGSLVVFVLTMRFVGKRAHAAAEARVIVAVPAQGWLAELEREPLAMDPGKPRIMLAARGAGQAAFAVDLAHKRGASLFAVYVRTLRVMDITPGAVPRVQDDPGALESLGSAAVLARQHNVPFVPIYVCSATIADEILDYTVTFGCDTLILGKTKRRALTRVIEGDVITKIAEHLPDEVSLITRA